jgi:MYXO-CTERM domain-containing protein
MCAKHAAFAIPSPLATGAGAACTTAAQTVKDGLADLGACQDVDQPELYVLGYKPASPDTTVTSTIEGLVGLAGEALSHATMPANLLPTDFVPTLRTVLVKLRNDSLAARVTQAHAGYTQALGAITANPTCFDASLAKQVSDLGTELDAANAYLAKTKSDGEAAHAHEDICLAAHARTRTTLPFASLTDDERRFVAFYLGGTYWRMRGGGLMPLGSTQAARWDFMEQPFTRIGELTGGKDGSDAAFDLYLAIFQGWSQWQDMGDSGAGGDKYYDLVGMTGRGSAETKNAATTLGGRGYDTLDLTTGGLQMGPCYFYAHEQLPLFRYADKMQSPPYGAFIEGYTAIGEWCSGASIALGFAKTLLAGTPTGKPPTVTLCAGRTCGDDTCGGSCGTCSGGLACKSGQCVSDVTPASTGPSTSPSPASPPAGAPPPDDAGTPPSSSGGCGCVAASSTTSSAALGAALVGVAVAFARRRRRS